MKVTFWRARIAAIGVIARFVIPVAFLALVVPLTVVDAQEPPPKPVRLAWGGGHSTLETGSLRIAEGEETEIALEGFTASESNADFLYYRPRFTVGDPAIIELTPSTYPYTAMVKAVGSGTTWVLAEVAGIRKVLPIVAGRALALTVAADIPPQFRVGRIRITVPGAPAGMPSLRLAVGEEIQLGVDALYEQSMQSVSPEIYPATWVSSDPSVVEVARPGTSGTAASIANIVARKNGSATITLSVQGVKTVLPVLVGTARSGQAPAGQGNSYSTSKEPFTVAKPTGPVLTEGSQVVALRAPEVFGAKTYRLERSQPAAGATQFVGVATNFRLERGGVVLSDTTAPGTRTGGPVIYRVVAIDHAGKEVPGEPTAILTDGASISGGAIKRGPGGAEITWTAAPGAQYKVARFTADGSGWTITDAAASGTFTDPSPPSGATYVVLGFDGGAYARYGPTLRLR